MILIILKIGHILSNFVTYTSHQVVALVLDTLKEVKITGDHLLKVVDALLWVHTRAQIWGMRRSIVTLIIHRAWLLMLRIIHWVRKIWESLRVSVIWIYHLIVWILLPTRKPLMFIRLRLLLEVLKTFYIGDVLGILL